MPDFKIYQNKSPTLENYTYLVDVQSELLSALETRLVIPLIKSEEIGRHLIKNLNPSITVNRNEFIAMTQQMAAIPKGILGNLVEDVDFSRSEILDSIDFLVTGI